MDYRVTGETETAYRYTMYSYDSRGNMTSAAQLSQNSTPTTEDIKNHQIRYTYNADGNLAKVSYPTTKGGVQGVSYTYDANGWIEKISATVKTGETTKEATVCTYTYDANGNQTAVESSKSGDTQTYVYDAKNRLSEVSIRKKNGTTVTVQKNVYNGDDQRIQKVEGNQTINYDYQDGVVISTFYDYHIIFIENGHVYFVLFIF